MEQQPNSPERVEINKPELEASPEVARGPEKAVESEADKQRQVETARQQLERQPVVERSNHSENQPKAESSGLDRRANYKATMASLQRHLSTPSRAFSKVIHNPAVDKTSEALGKTVMRPSVTLGATTTALIVGGFTYFIAKHYGYGLSGSEILLSLVVGGLVGVGLEGFSKLFRRRS